jgi:hypothetical protein
MSVDKKSTDFSLTFADFSFLLRVTESKRLFESVNDHRFWSLMKTGRPEYYIPSVVTLSHNVQNVLVHVCKQVVHMLQVSHQWKVMNSTGVDILT